ncbi:MAG: porin family protein [Lentimicrobiaceae bacterium]|nr:porin family protein [Lentimicrobiaceae bacterium]
MKRIFLLLLVLGLAFALHQPASAQYKSVELGIKLSPNMGWLKSNQKDYNSTGVRPGIAWGMVSDFYFARNYAFSSGFNFNFHGGDLSYPDMLNYDAGTVERRYRLKYIEIPATIKMKTNEMNGYRIYGMVGVGLSVRLNASARDIMTIPGKIVDKTGFIKVSDETHLMKMSMIVGAGVDVPLDNSSFISVGVHFNNGFTDVLKGKNKVNPALGHEGIPNFIELAVALMF